MKLLFFILAIGRVLSIQAEVPLRVNVLALTGATARDEFRIARALELIEAIVNSEEFKSRLVKMRYKVGKFEYSGYSQTSLNPEEVLESILIAREVFKGGSDHVIDLFLDMYYEESSTIGYTSYSDPFVHMNRYFHDDYTPVETAGNLFHEWLHKLGFDHSQRYNSYRPHSVPYKLGNLIAEMSAEIEAGGDPLRKAMLMEEDVKCYHHALP